MGVPTLFRWLSTKYPKITSSVVEDIPPSNVSEREYFATFDFSRPNPNGFEVDNLYLDMNGIIHPCCHPEGRPAPSTEQEMMAEVCKYLDRIMSMVRPRKVLYMAVDGVAPRAKMNQQRSRRFKSALDAKDRAALSSGSDEDDSSFDSNCITPGTPFMGLLRDSIVKYIQDRIAHNESWKNLYVIYSDSSVPGEGEHKIMNFIREQRESPSYNPNQSHVIYGLDADLIMLTLATHEPRFWILREDVFLDEARRYNICFLCNTKGHFSEDCPKSTLHSEHQPPKSIVTDKPFIFLDISILREYLKIEFFYDGRFPSITDLERLLDDWVFMSFFVGNDFLPHLPSMDIREGAIDLMLKIYKENFIKMGGYVTKDGRVYLDRIQILFEELGKKEQEIFVKRKETFDRKEAARKRREEQEMSESRVKGKQPESVSKIGIAVEGMLREKRTTELENPEAKRNVELENPEAKQNTNEDEGTTMQNDTLDIPLIATELSTGSNEMKIEDGTKLNNQLTAEDKPKSDDELKLKDKSTHEEKRNMDDKAKSEHRSLVSSTANKTQSSISLNSAQEDDVRFWEPGAKGRYYEKKLKIPSGSNESIQEITKCYVEGLCWVMAYYYQGCVSWKWFYPFHYAPMTSDFVKINDLQVKFERSMPFKAYEQLLSVLPAASKSLIPQPFHWLMTDKSSQISDFYPDEFPIDLNGKKFAWQGVVLLPFIDEKRLIEAVEHVYPTLSPEDLIRNESGADLIFMSLELAERVVINSERFDTKLCPLDSKLVPITAELLKTNEQLSQFSGFLSNLQLSSACSCYLYRGLGLPVEHKFKSRLLPGTTMPKQLLTHDDYPTESCNYARNTQRSNNRQRDQQPRSYDRPRYKQY